MSAVRFHPLGGPSSREAVSRGYTPRRYAPPLLIEGIFVGMGLHPLYEKGCPQGEVCKDAR